MYLFIIQVDSQEMDPKNTNPILAFIFHALRPTPINGNEAGNGVGGPKSLDIAKDRF